MLDRIRRFSPRTEFVLVTTLCFLYFAAGSLLLLLSGVRHSEMSTARVLRGVGFEVLALIVVLCMLRIRGWRMEQLGLPFSWRAAAGGIAGIPLFVMYLLLYWITTTFVLLLWPAAREVWLFRYTVTAPWWVMLLFIVVNSMFEETTVTGYVIASLSKDGAALAITASTLLRFVYHLYQGPLASLSILPLGLLFGAMFWRWRNLWPLIVAHTIANVVAFAVNPGG